MPLPPIAILAGGLATRLRPITTQIPKSMVPVAGRPFLFHQLALLRQNGASKVVICVGHLGDMIESHFGDGADWGLELRYSHDGPRLLGTGGAIRKALPLLGDAFIVLYGDSYLPCDYGSVADAYFRSGKNALMTVYKNCGHHEVSNVSFHQELVQEYDKRKPLATMNFVDYGLSVFSHKVFYDLPLDVPVDLSDIQHVIAKEGGLAGYEIAERFYEIGSRSGLDELNRLLQTQPSNTP